MRPTFDEHDAAILTACVLARDMIDGPRVGDFVYMPDGSLLRFTHDWGDGLQTTCQAFGGGSFYLDRSGSVSFSGALDPPIARECIERTSETRDGAFWFFHHGFPGANLGVDCTAPCRVYRVISCEAARITAAATGERP